MEKTGICRLRRIFKKYEICHIIGSEFSFWRTVQATTMIKYALAFTATANVTIMTSLPMIHTLNLKCFYWLMQKDVLRRSHMIGHPAVPHVASVYLLMGIKLEPVMLSVRRVLDQINTVGGFWKIAIWLAETIKNQHQFENLSVCQSFQMIQIHKVAVRGIQILRSSPIIQSQNEKLILEKVLS